MLFLYRVLTEKDLLALARDVKGSIHSLGRVYDRSRNVCVQLVIVISIVQGLLLGAGVTYAGELNHRFVNPNFGGSPLNGTQLLGQASAQNKFKDPDAETRTEESDLDKFQDRLNSAVLGQISRQIVSQMFGEDGVETGQFSTGTFDIDISEGLEGVMVEIVDSETGDSTTVTIPFF